MKKIYKNFCKNIFFYFMIIAVVIAGTVAYYRFVVKWDYSVEYEGICDPAINDCFIYCEDADDCYYYSIRTKYAPDLYDQCGEDITDCEEAEVCFPNDRNCSVTFCDLEIDGDDCEMLTEEELKELEKMEEKDEEVVGEAEIKEKEVEEAKDIIEAEARGEAEEIMEAEETSVRNDDQL